MMIVEERHLPKVEAAEEALQLLPTQREKLQITDSHLMRLLLTIQWKVTLLMLLMHIFYLVRLILLVNN